MAFCVEDKLRFIVLTGAPGIGKTTVVKKVCERLRELGHHINGFYTEEVRTNHQRQGFDVVSFNGNRASLARLGEHGKYRVGRYVVDIQSFEKIALPSMKKDYSDTLIVIDEVGKMELHSFAFLNAFEKVINDRKAFGLLTIPLSKGKANDLLEKLRAQCALLLHITVDNRNDIVKEIFQSLLELKKHSSNS